MKFIPGKKIVVWIDQYLGNPRLDPEAKLRKRWVWFWMLVTFVFVDITASVTIFVLKFSHSGGSGQCSLSDIQLVFPYFPGLNDLIWSSIFFSPFLLP